MTIFSKIAAGEIPSYKCAENEQFYAFLDIDPVTKGHTLVVPRKEVDYIFDMDDDELAAFEVFAKKVARAIKTVFPCKKVAQVVLGLEVNHAHIHLLPMNSEADVDFKHHVQVEAEEQKRELLKRIFQSLSGIGITLGFSGIRYYQDGDIQSLHIPVYYFP